MKVSGFTFARNAVRLRYPLVESIRSLLPGPNSTKNRPSVTWAYVS